MFMAIVLSSSAQPLIDSFMSEGFSNTFAMFANISMFVGAGVLMIHISQYFTQANNNRED
jgi:hypothetical protein